MRFTRKPGNVLGKFSGQQFQKIKALYLVGLKVLQSLSPNMERNLELFYIL